MDLTYTYTVISLVIYLVLNVVGTIYYSKLSTRQVSPTLQGWCLASVILGWLGLPILNISSPIVYATSPPIAGAK